MPTAKSAAVSQPIRSADPRSAVQPQRRRRRAYSILGAVIGVALLLPAQAMGAPPVAEAAGGCAGWQSTTRPPDYIRVLRVQTGRIERVQFRKYVITVMGKEWPSYLPQAVVEAGAVATKQYAWYHTLGQARQTGDGRCYDVRDSTGDQLYKPNRARVRADHYRAVDKTWGVTLLKNGQLFMTGYRRGGRAACAADATGYKLFAMSAKRCANKGWDYQRILRAYYSPGLDIRIGSSVSSRSSAGTATPSPRPEPATPSARPSRRSDANQQSDRETPTLVVDDRSRAIAWHGSWRRVRKSQAIGSTVTYSGLAGSSATFRFSGKSLELMGPKGSGRGWLDIFVDGRRKARVDLYSATQEQQLTLFEWQWRQSKTRTVRIEVVGAEGRSRADIDAILIA